MGSSILLAEPYETARKGHRAIFAHFQDAECIYEVTTEEGLKKYLECYSIDFVVVHQLLITDITLLSRSQFVIIADELDKDMLLAAFNHGARGYLLDYNLDKLLHLTLDFTETGREKIFFLDPTISPWLLDCMNEYVFHLFDMNKLTSREQEVFNLLHKGLKDVDIAEQLCISQPTIRTHIANILRKLNITRQQIKKLPLPLYNS